MSCRGFICRVGVSAVLAVLGAGAARAQPAVGEMLFPVQPTCLTSPFGVRPAPGPNAVGFHNGIDLRAPAGGAVFAVADGRVVGIDRRGAGGLEIAVLHQGAAGPYTALYSHLGLLAPAFAQGRGVVKRGERLARIGRTGVTYGTHLFFEIKVAGRPVDPAPLFPVLPCPGK
jgi:murein DD-endopeptidase MepM/ murein hydrolase activator NlpD